MAEQEFVLEKDAEIEDLLVVCDTANATYKKAVERREEWLADFKGRPVCREMLGCWAETASGTMNNGENEARKLQVLPGKKEREKKKRKIMKGFKKWTGTADAGERKFKGWSDNGHKALEQYTHAVIADVEEGRCALWEKAFQKITAMQQAASLNEDQPAVPKYTVNRSIVWEL